MQTSLTILIPILNGMPYLTEMLASLEAQTFREFTVILWDNGSTDGSVEEAHQWIPNRLTGRVIIGEPLPLHQCLARLVQEARTEFCARLDADDICHPQRFEVQLREFYQNPSLNALGTQADFIDSESKKSSDSTEFPLEFCDILCGMLVENQILHPTVMFRREAVLEIGNYLVAKPCEDYDLWMRLSARGKLSNLPAKLLQYRLHPQSVIASARNSGDLSEPNFQCVQRHCMKMYKISPDIYRKLRFKVHPFSFLALIPAALSISRYSGVTLMRVLRSKYFLFSARCLTSKSDYTSRIIWGIIQRLDWSIEKSF